MQFPLLNLFALGDMDSLQVTTQQSTNQLNASSNKSSRSASPCKLDRRTPVPPTPPSSAAAAAGSSVASATVAAGSGAAGGVGAGDHHPPQHHHVKTLSLGSADSSKSDGVGVQQRPASSTTARHRSPTTSTCISGGGGRGGLGGGGDTAMDESSFLNTTSTSAMGADDSLLFLGLDVTDPELCYPSSYISNGSSEHKATTISGRGDEESDGGNSRTATVLEHLTNKIVRVKDLIRMEQKLRDDNVYEYLKLASNADKQQVQRIKAVFEKKNQKSAQIILQLQKKLNNYQKRVQELEHGVYTQSSHRPPREVLRDMGQGLKNVGGNIRDGITGFSGSVMSKPREFAHLIKNKFGSADNISQMSRPTGTTGSEGSGTNVSGSDPTDAKGAQAHQQQQQQQQPAGQGASGGGHQHVSAHAHHHGHHGHRPGHGSATLPASLHAATSHHSVGAQGGGPAGAQQHKFPSDEGSECSSVTSESLERYHSSRGAEPLSDKDIYNMFNKQLQAHQLEIERLREKVEASKGYQQEIQFLSNSIQDERFKTERLEEQINDLTELHQNEVENLKQTMADMEEKVQYQSEERLRDIHEMLEHCQTKIQKMEHQALQQQQYVMLEGLDNSNARALVVKLINVLLTVLQVVLLLVATCAGIIMPFLRTRVRILTTLTIVLAAVFVLRQWPEVADIGSHVMKRLKDTLDPVK